MKIIRIFSDYDTSETMSLMYIRSDELLSDKKFNVDYCFTIGDDYTHAIIVNKAMPALTIPKTNVIGISHEPPEFLLLAPGKNRDEKFIQYANENINKYYIGEKYDLPDVFVEGNGYIFHTNILRRIVKNKLMSLMISEKGFFPGHVYRHQIAEMILLNNLPIDIFGRGCKFYKKINTDTDISNNTNISENFEQLKGEFDGNEHIENYLFHISIENTQHPHYFSEKITNPLLLSTNVLYLGCSNIANYFKKGIHLLNGNIKHDMNLIVNILNNWKEYYQSIDTEQVKKIISIKNIIDEFE